MVTDSIRLAAITLLLLTQATSRVWAQNHVADVLSFLVTNQSVSTGSVERDTAAAQATSATISKALLTSLASLPVTSTSGSFAYELNPTLGTVERVTHTFGPVFVDRALTSGNGTVGLGLSLQHLRFTSLDGHNLRDGSLVTTANQFVDEAQPFDVDQLTLNIDADVATLYSTVGVGSHIDLSAAVPVVSLRLDGTRVNTYRGQAFTQATASAHAIGLADMLVRGKVNVYRDGDQSLAVAVDARLPTGHVDDLLGTGKASVRFSGIGSLEGPALSATATAGVSIGGVGNEFTYGAALATAVSPQLTVSAEALGRFVDTPGDIVSVAQAHPTLAGVETIRLVPGTGHLNTLTIAPGLKWNVTDTWIVVANVGVPLTKAGLEAPFLPFLGVEYTLGR
jgi:hypothetical protein